MRKRGVEKRKNIYIYRRNFVSNRLKKKKKEKEKKRIKFVNIFLFREIRGIFVGILEKGYGRERDAMKPEILKFFEDEEKREFKNSRNYMGIERRGGEEERRMGERRAHWRAK